MGRPDNDYIVCSISELYHKSSCTYRPTLDVEIFIKYKNQVIKDTKQIIRSGALTGLVLDLGLLKIIGGGDFSNF